MRPGRSMLAVGPSRGGDVHPTRNPPTAAATATTTRPPPHARSRPCHFGFGPSDRARSTSTRGGPSLDGETSVYPFSEPSIVRTLLG